MRAIDIFLRMLTVVTFITLIVLPDRIGPLLGCASLFAAGLWGVLFPPGMLSWAKAAHPELDPSDESLWWISRLIGSFFIVFSSLILATMLASR